MIRALIILECVLLVIVALDRVVGVPTTGGTIEQAERERVIGKDVSMDVRTDGQADSVRPAIAPPASARSHVPQSPTPDERAHAIPRTKPAESSVASTAPSQRPLRAAASH